VPPSKSFTESASSDISVELHDNDNLASSLSLMSMEREGPARSSDEESGNDDDIPNGPPRRQPRSNHQHSAPQQVAGPCLLCEANMNDFAGSTGVSDVERTIVRLEKRLRGRLADEHIFARMLELRQQFVDDVLRKLGRPCTPWTVEMLRAHYHPVSGHEFDMVRQLDAELANINKFMAELQENMYIANPDTGECELDMRKHPLLKEWSKRKSAVFQERERALANLQKEADGVEQELHALRKITLQSAAIQTTPAIGAHVEQTGMQMDQAYTSAYSAACGLPLGGFDVM